MIKFAWYQIGVQHHMSTDIQTSGVRICISTRRIQGTKTNRPLNVKVKGPFLYLVEVYPVVFDNPAGKTEWSN